jgi:hypothetical protein
METKYVTRRTLDYTHFDDCITGKELTKLTEMDCDADPEASSVVVFRQAMIPSFVLGQSAEISVVDRETISERNQKHDVALQYGCKYRTWQVHQSDHPTVYGALKGHGQIDQWKVHPETCEFVNQDGIPDVWAAKWYEKQKSAEQIVRE